MVDEESSFGTTSRSAYLEHLKESLHAALLRAVFVHQYTAQVQEARVLMHLVQLHHLCSQSPETAESEFV